MLSRQVEASRKARERQLMNNEVQAMLTLFKDHTGIVNTLWTLLSTVALALLGFVYKEPLLRNNAKVLTVLTIGFAALAAGNQVAMTRSQTIVFVVAQQFHEPQFLETAKPLSPSIGAVLAAHRANTPNHVRLAHIGFDFLVVVGLWIPFIFFGERPRGA
jgi:hypothetical protein